jgi:hypothetical protein
MQVSSKGLGGGRSKAIAANCESWPATIPAGAGGSPTATESVEYACWRRLPARFGFCTRRCPRPRRSGWRSQKDERKRRKYRRFPSAAVSADLGTRCHRFRQRASPRILGSPGSGDFPSFIPRTANRGRSPHRERYRLRGNGKQCRLQRRWAIAEGRLIERGPFTCARKRRDLD